MTNGTVLSTFLASVTSSTARRAGSGVPFVAGALTESRSRRQWLTSRLASVVPVADDHRRPDELEVLTGEAGAAPIVNGPV